MNTIKNEKITVSQLTDLLYEVFEWNDENISMGIEFSVEKGYIKNGCFAELRLNAGAPGASSDVVADADIVAIEENWIDFKANLKAYSDQLNRAAIKLSSEQISNKCQIQTNSGFKFESFFDHENPESFLIEITPKKPELGEAYFKSADITFEIDDEDDVLISIFPSDFEGLVESDIMSYDENFPCNSNYHENLVEDMLSLGMMGFIQSQIAGILEVEASDLNIFVK